MCSIQFSSITALFEACNTDIRNVNAVALLDLKNAFATVNHDILLSKLHLYSISGAGLEINFFVREPAGD